ncbi:MAG TPA: carboxylating nicotinate-nucleotide diphosphorylase [Candidatus Diapherotrites archaeon]|uniref:Nicotinate-nucleotide pyrophosphorylase [carboxylating] n=1 Tax=Candidatus Iainarchaeum sp. TaxID=3101447 RepID=A0A7J4JKL2_9ARCH|nr:carboxylating nicotinate-nucleotide diphosphorylase [Candidatus Diapherotrites archaeon]HIH16457.1 carboxylating nicotinate-nucleotide diphosphorylase [Candidatus Diapherotrites archaeon]
MVSALLTDQMQKKLLQILNEDIGSGDITAALVPRKKCRATIAAGEQARVAGLEEVAYLFEQAKVSAKLHVNDGDLVEKGQIVLEAEGVNQNVLAVERTALNILGRMSGVATKCWQAVQAAKNPDMKILLTRKTMPGFNEFDKKACAFGGVGPHRMNLSDMVLVKENHLAFFETLPAALFRAKKSKYQGPIEIEVQNLQQAVQAMRTGIVDVVLLDNFSVEDARKAIPLLKKMGEVKIELSGGITLANLREYAKLDPDFLSMGELTKDAKTVDFSLDIVEVLEGEA